MPKPQMMTRAAMEDVIANGGSVLHNGAIITNPAHLPTDEEMMAHDPDHAEVAEASIDAQVQRLLKAKENIRKMTAARQAAAPPAAPPADDPAAAARAAVLGNPVTPPEPPAPPAPSGGLHGPPAAPAAKADEPRGEVKPGPKK